MSDVFTYLASDGITRAIAREKLSAFRRDRSANGAEVVSFTFRDAIDAATRFQELEPVVIFKNGAPWFSGLASGNSREAGPRSQSYSVTLVGPWAEFTERPFFAAWKKHGTDDENYTLGRGHTCILDNGDRVTAGEWLNSLARGVKNLEFSSTGRRAFEPGEAIETQFTLREWSLVQPITDLTCADAFDLVLRFFPDAVIFFDHTNQLSDGKVVPRMYCQRAAELPEVTVALGGDSRGGWAAGDVENLLVKAARGVVVQWKYEAARDDEEEADEDEFNARPLKLVVVTDAYPPTITPGEKRVLLTTFDTEAPADGEDFFADENADEVPIGKPVKIARRLYDSLQSFPWGGRLVYRGPTVQEEVKPGVRVNLTGGRSGWARMQGVVQSVSDDIITGTCEVTFGQPPSLGASDFAERMRWLRRAEPGATEGGVQKQTEGTSPGTSHFGFGEKARPADDAGKVFALVEGGLPVRYRIPAKKVT